MTPPKPPALPAACTECVSTLQLVSSTASSPSQMPYKMARSAAGQMRIDYGTTSVITNPANETTTLLDHVKKEVRVIPTPAGVTPPHLLPPAMAGVPGMSPPPATPQMAVKDLGVKMIQGVEAQGHQITLPPLAPPKPPAVPNAPGIPGAPGGIASPAQIPTVAESWVSTKLNMPVLSRITGSFGQQMCHCKNTVPGEPPASHFQIPPDYKQVGLPPAPAPPAMPAAPKIPGAPAAPAMPAAPKIPGVPAAPAIPAAPKIPGAPAAPAIPPAPKSPFKF